jgi:small-conductance mechanosensitive channel
VKTNRVINFINFIYEETEENNKIIEEELEEAGLDTGKFQQNMLNFLDDAERELKLSGGGVLKKRYLNLVDSFEKLEDRIHEKFEEYSIQIAFRDFESKLTEKEKKIS